MLVLTESKARYSRVSPIPKLINPLSRARNNCIFVIFLEDLFLYGMIESIASVGIKKSILPVAKMKGSLLFSITLKKTIPNPQHKTVPRLATTPISDVLDC